MKKILIFLVFTAIYALEDYNDDYRKHYGLSFYKQCRNYVKTFKCMTACKSVGYQVFRLDNKCKCTCHSMKTTTILPFFKWRTNGTTRKVPKTQSPHLYHVVGTLSPATFDDSNETEIPSTTTPSPCPTLKPHPSSAKTSNESSTKSTEPLREKGTTPAKDKHSTNSAKNDSTVNVNAPDNVKGNTDTTGDSVGNTTISISSAPGQGGNSTEIAGTSNNAGPGANTVVDNTTSTGAGIGAETGAKTDVGGGGGTDAVTGGSTVPADNN